MSSTPGGSAIFPPPERFAHPSSAQDQSSPSSSGSSSRKRKRDAVSASASAVTKFSEKSKTLLRSLYPRCWFCEADTKLDNCHVIAQADRSFYASLARGLLTFETLADADNGIALCGRCHKEYDDTQSPGFIIVPTDLSYFIEFERADYDRRTCAAIQDKRPTKRAVPSPTEYHEHQCRNAQSSGDACGGLYQRIILRNFLSPLEYGSSSGIGGPHDAMPTHPVISPAPWHGAPLAPLLRTFMVHGSPVVGMEAVASEIRDQLRTLQDLYARADPVTWSRIDEVRTEVASPVVNTSHATRNEGEQQAPAQRPAGSEAAAPAQDGHVQPSGNTGHGTKHGTTYCSKHQVPEVAGGLAGAQTRKRRRQSPDSQIPISEHDSAIYMKPANASICGDYSNECKPQRVKRVKRRQKNRDEEDDRQAEDASSAASLRNQSKEAQGAESDDGFREIQNVQMDPEPGLRERHKNIGSRDDRQNSHFVWGPDSSSGNKAIWFLRMNGLSSADPPND